MEKFDLESNHLLMKGSSRFSLAHRALLPALVALITFAVFVPALSGGFVNWDDDVNFTTNPHYRGFSFENLRWMFTDRVGHYIPLTWLTLSADYVLWGMDPAGYHLSNLIFHAINASLCFAVLLRLLHRASPDSTPTALRLSAAGGALFFAIHPLRVESVAWVTERRDLTSGLFILLTILAYLKAVEPGRPKHWMGLVALLFAGSLLCKTTGMMLPLALLVLDVYPLRRIAPDGLLGAAIRPLLLEKLPIFSLMAAAIVATRITQASVILGGTSYPLIHSVLEPGHRLMFYVMKTVAPWNLNPMYFFRLGIGMAHAMGWGAGIALTACLWRFRKPWPAAFAAWVAFGILIAPVSGVFQAGYHFAADRYTYLPCIPFAALFAAVLLLGCVRKPLATATLAGTALICLGVLSWRQSGIWKDSLTLWTHSLTLDSRCSVAYLNRGTARMDLGDRPGAVADYSSCIEVDPREFKAWNSRGLARESLGDLEGARADYDRAVALSPSYLPARANRGAFLRKINDLEGALSDAEEALRSNPNWSSAYVLRASVRRAKGDLAGAFSDLDRAVELSPLKVEGLNNRAVLFMQVGRPRQAFSDYDRALTMNPTNPPVLVGRAQARRLLGDTPGAIADLKKALQYAPRNWPLRSDIESMLQNLQAQTNPR
jgi:tetratricopeptide (TPR) repeat protein